jgi:hypothetical protein
MLIPRERFLRHGKVIVYSPPPHPLLSPSLILVSFVRFWSQIHFQIQWSQTALVYHQGSVLSSSLSFFFADIWLVASCGLCCFVPSFFFRFTRSKLPSRTRPNRTSSFRFIRVISFLIFVQFLFLSLLYVVSVSRNGSFGGLVCFFLSFLCVKQNFNIFPSLSFGRP